MIVILLALVIRLVGIASRPIWYDEAFSILFSEKGPGDMLYGTLAPAGGGSSDIHPLGYYIPLWLWIQCFGPSLLAVRALTIIAGLCVVALIYLLGIELVNESTGFGASLLGAILPFQVHYSQEIRMYAFMAMWLLLSTYAYWRGVRSKSWAWWAIFAASAALAQYTHNLSAVYLVVLAASPLITKDWRTLRPLALAILVALLLYWPWLLQLPGQLAKVQNSYWIGRPGVDRIFTLFLLYLPHLPLPDSWLAPGLAIAAFLIAVGGYQTWCAFRDKQRHAKIGLCLALLSFAPALLLWLISQFQPIYVERSLLAPNAIFCLWLTWALFRTPIPRLIRSLSFLLILICAGAGLYQHVAYTGFPYGPFDAMDIYLRDEMQAGDVIVHSNKLSLLPAVYFDRDLPQIFIADPAGSGTDTLASATREVLGLSTAPDLETATQGSSRVWLIIFQESIDEYTQVGRPTHPHLAYLGEHFNLNSSSSWNDLRIFLYERAPN